MASFGGGEQALRGPLRNAQAACQLDAESAPAAASLGCRGEEFGGGV